ncbi:DUF983 domain-containing protein [Pseudahrensia aquimaris]|uniref:DUF983 domain-containing protein n=1 Tax=Pseudahrensia aquimaris TaxID=744461 RepID=A0ABW3FHS8_9HYPH
MSTTTFTETKRPIWPAIKRGLRSRCPNCGEGKMFSSFVKVNGECPSCGEELHHHRADDFPPYLVIFIVGHVIITGVLLVEVRYAISTWAHLAIWIPLTIAMSLALLQPLKGGVIGMQWATRMHGFGGHPDDKGGDQ